MNKLTLKNLSKFVVITTPVYSLATLSAIKSACTVKKKILFFFFYMDVQTHEEINHGSRFLCNIFVFFILLDIRNDCVNHNVHCLTAPSHYLMLNQCWFLITMTSQWVRLRLKSPASPVFTQSFIRAQIKENIKAPCHWPLCGEFTGDRWIPRTNGQ